MKQIEIQLKNWRESRNITTFPLTIKNDMLKEVEEVRLAIRNNDIENYVEELADVAIFALNGLGLLNVSHKPTRMSVVPTLNNLESYINNIRVEMPVQTVNILNIIITMCNELVTAKRYDFKKVVLEKINLLNSRRQSMKEKNTFAKLRRTNKALKNKFEAANESLRLATEEIDRLNKALDIKDIYVKSLEIKENELIDKIYRLYDNIAEVNKLNTDNYNAWIKEHETNGKLSIVLTIMSLVIFGLIGTIIGVIA